MEDLFGIDARRQAVADNIQKALGAGYEPEGTDENTEVQKARSGVYEDNAKNRRLNRVGQKYGGNGKPDEDGGGKRQPKQEDEPKGGNEKKQEESGEKKTQDMSSHASKASDGALKRAAADEKAPKEVRDAANAELKKRGEKEEGESESGYKMNKYVDKDGNERYQVISPEGHVSYDGDKKGAEKTMKKMEKWVEKQKKEKEIKKVEDSFTEKEWGEVNEVMDSIKRHYPDINFKKFNKRDSIAAGKTSMGNWRIYVKDEGDWLDVATIGKEWLSEDVAKKMGWIENFENN